MLAKIVRLLKSYNSFLRDLGFLAWFFGVVVYPLVGAMLAIGLGVYVHPLASLLPMIPPLAAAIREDIRRNRIVMSEAFESTWTEQQRAINDYIELVKRARKE